MWEVRPAVYWLSCTFRPAASVTFVIVVGKELPVPEFWALMLGDNIIQKTSFHAASCPSRLSSSRSLQTLLYPCLCVCIPTCHVYMWAQDSWLKSTMWVKVLNSGCQTWCQGLYLLSLSQALKMVKRTE